MARELKKLIEPRNSSENWYKSIRRTISKNKRNKGKKKKKKRRRKKNGTKGVLGLNPPHETIFHVKRKKNKKREIPFKTKGGRPEDRNPLRRSKSQGKQNHHRLLGKETGKTRDERFRGS